MARIFVVMALLGCTSLCCTRADSKSRHARSQATSSAATQPSTKPAFALREIASIKPPRMGVEAIAISPDGKLLAMGGGFSNSLRSGGYLAMWDLRTGKYLQMTEGRDAYKLVKFTADGQKLMAASHYEVHVWDVRKWERNVIARNWHFVKDIAVAGNGKLLAIGGSMPGFWSHSGITVYDVGTGKQIRSFRGPFTEALAFSPDSSALAAASLTRVTVWNTSSWVRVGKVTAVTTDPYTTCCGRIEGVSFTRDNKLLMLNLSSVDVWDRAKNKSLWSAATHTVAFSSDGRRMATVEWIAPLKAKDLVLRDAPAKNPIARQRFQDLEIYGLTLSADGMQLAWVDVTDKYRIVVCRIERKQQ